MRLCLKPRERPLGVRIEIVDLKKGGCLQPPFFLFVVNVMSRNRLTCLRILFYDRLTPLEFRAARMC